VTDARTRLRDARTLRERHASAMPRDLAVMLTSWINDLERSDTEKWADSFIPWQQVAHGIRERIRAGGWDRRPFPSASSFAWEYSVSIGTVRKALHALHAIGEITLVEHGKHRGSYRVAGRAPR
jgi:hypothetical protein